MNFKAIKCCASSKAAGTVKTLLMTLLITCFSNNVMAQASSSTKIDWGVWGIRPLGNAYAKGEPRPRVYMDPGPHAIALLEEDAQRKDESDLPDDNSETQQPCFIDIRQIKGAIHIAFLGHSEKGDSSASAICVLSFDKKNDNGELKFLRTGHVYEFQLVYTIGSGLVEIMLTDERDSWHFGDARYDGAGIRK